MFSKTWIRTKAASVKTTMTALETALEAGNIEAAKTETARLHAKLNGAAHKLAEIFDTDVEDFSGGTGKPQEN